jgi:hypothetical protein
VFGRNKEEKQARRAAAQAEVDRLRALSPSDMAVEVLPKLAQITAEHRTVTYVGALALMLRLLDGHHGAGGIDFKVLLYPVQDALQRLEHANLVVGRTINDSGTQGWRLTDLGQQALAAGDVAARLLGGAV